MDERILNEWMPQWRGCSVTITPLGGGLTNRNFRVDVNGTSYVVRVAGQGSALLGIDRACELACSQTAAALDVSPEIVAFLPEHSVTVRRFVPGQVLTPEALRDPKVLARVVAALKRFHDGPRVPGVFSPFAAVRNYCAEAQARGVTFPNELQRALEHLRHIEQRLQSSDPPCPCHNDLLAGNFIDDGAAVRIIDWEYAGMGDRFFDLGNLAVNNEFAPDQEELLLRLYFGAADPERLRRLRWMRLASDMREAMWGFLQSAISNLEVDYRAYGQKHLERFLGAVSTG